MKPAIIGLTGGIGSGKTTVAGFFRELGVPVYIADEEAKKILTMRETIDELHSKFGSSIFTGDLPDRKKIAGIVFNNPDKLAILNAIIHPKVQLHFMEWVNSKSNFKFVIKEAAILFESGSYRQCDKIILVTAPIKTRIERVMKRDAITREEVLQRMANQWQEEEKIKLSDFIITNTTLQHAQTQAIQVYQSLNQ